MEKLYYQVPYVKEFDAVVTGCEPVKNGFQVTLDRTAFYPEGGGQPADTGMLGEARVSDTKEKGDDIYHLTDRPLAVGSSVHGVLDWEPRFSRMQEHTGEHIVSGLIHAKYGYENVGFHMGEEIRVDLSGVLSWEELMEIEREANRIVWDDRPVLELYPSAEELKAMEYRSKKELTGQVRIISIPGADSCACCGTHVSRTGEIGLIKILSMLHYKGGVRFFMHCGLPALLDAEKKTDQNHELMEIFSAKTYETAKAARKMAAENEEKSIRLSSLLWELLEYKSREIVPRDTPLVLREDSFSNDDLRKYCDLLLKKEKAPIVALLAAKPEGGFSYCIGSVEKNMREAAKVLNRELSGRGGGSPQMIFGAFGASEEAVREAVQRL